ncbi:peptidase U62 modulator of DNA gyrase [Rippkaea orientalis PCC 8801]|uniref:Peptidase U62 modulator of DNA gyrase n=1 Tax=Rippkaea orientalis (strain PCC 8801 / RF-1) TaxID=41431 RepID=B7K602_RIPO1|nr:TldD/PmbA family protein [Rippkaea orientalis]ACK68055.1 peptidase U62 modulator of DNA gyrase [Rippkaea orientalis PCC 8801]
MQINLQTILNSINLNADWIGLRQVTETTTTRSMRDGKPQSNGRSQTQGIMVEVLAQGQFGYSATNYLTIESIQKAAEVAYKQAINAANWAVHSFSIDQRPKAVGHYYSPYLKPLELLSPQDINDLLFKVCETLKVSDKIVKTSALAQITETEVQLISSNGSDIYQKFLFIVSNYAATAQDASIIQTRTDSGLGSRCYQGGTELLDLETSINRAKIIGEQAVELLSAPDCPTATTQLVLAPDQMMLQIHESIGHPLEIDRILGDERNYAGSSFVKLSDFGNLVYGSPLMNVTFDPSVSGQFASYGFDDGGLQATREYLIKDGILLRGLGSLESQTRAKIPGVANFRACSWNRAPIDRMANINLEPGTSHFNEMISEIEYGVYMESNRSWSIDDYRNKFQFGCEYAKLIENGQLTKTVKNPNYRGITNQFWRGLSQVGNESTVEMYGTPFCGKGEPNQAIRVGHSSPVCVFDNVEVFGGMA